MAQKQSLGMVTWHTVKPYQAIDLDLTHRRVLVALKWQMQNLGQPNVNEESLRDGREPVVPCDLWHADRLSYHAQHQGSPRPAWNLVWPVLVAPKGLSTTAMHA